MNLLTEEEMRDLPNIIVNEGYKMYKPYFVKTMRLTRFPFLRKSALFMGGTQLGLINALSKLENAIKQGKKLFDAEADAKKKRSLELGLKINIELVRVLKTITDGIAWRSLDYNRPLIRLLSNNQSPGTIDPDYAGWRKALQIRDFIIINDLTRCLRTADITRVYKDGKIMLYEIKKDGDVFKDLGFIFKEAKKHKRWFSRQEFRQFIAQMAIVKDEINIPIVEEGKLKKEIKVEILNLDFPIKTHLKEIQKMIRVAEKKGFVHKSLESGYFVAVQDFESMSKNGVEEFSRKAEEMKADFEKNRPQWSGDKKVERLALTSYDAFLKEGDEYPRNFTPASVLPFRAKDCVKIMMGHLFISVEFSIDELERKIIERGWTVEDKNLPWNAELDEKKKKREFKLEDYDKETNLFSLSRTDGDGVYRTSFPITELLIVLSTFYKTDFILDTLDMLFNRGRADKPKGQKTITMRFVQERKVLK